MNICLFSFARIYEDSMVASQRIAMLISKELKVPITTDLNIDEQPDKVDLLLIINGAYGYCRCLNRLGPLVERSERVVWVQNDYWIIPPKAQSGAESPFRLAFRNRAAAGKDHIHYWTTIKDNVKATKYSSYVNWNALTLDDKVTESQIKARRVLAGDDVFYFGSWRDGRAKYFDRYFTNPIVNITISSPLVKGKNKFAEKYKSPKIKHVDKITENFYTYLGARGMGLYLEDRKSHSEYHSPPNRFYEMLSAGLPIVFQSESGSTLRQAGYNPEPYQADTSMALERIVRRRADIGKQQRAEWWRKAMEDKAAIVPALHEAMRKMG